MPPDRYATSWFPPIDSSMFNSRPSVQSRIRAIVPRLARPPAGPAARTPSPTDPPGHRVGPPAYDARHDGPGASCTRAMATAVAIPAFGPSADLRTPPRCCPDRFAACRMPRTGTRTPVAPATSRQAGQVFVHFPRFIRCLPDPPDPMDPPGPINTPFDAKVHSRASFFPTSATKWRRHAGSAATHPARTGTGRDGRSRALHACGLARAFSGNLP